MRIIPAGLLALATLVVAPAADQPASAQGQECGCVTGPTCVIAQNGGQASRLECAWQQYNELNGHGQPPPTCTEENRADIRQLSYTGTVRWVLISEHINAVVREGLGADSGLAYNQACVPDAHYAEEGIDIAPTIYQTRVFNAITPENLAWLAMDQFFQRLGPPQPHLTPEPRTLVNIDTWLQVDGVPAGVQTSPTISVPGNATSGPIEVYAIAEATDVEWDMGDGSPPFTCPLHEAAEPPVCNTYSYQRSTAGQPDLTYYGSASLVWVGGFFINGVEQADVLLVPQEASFEIQVEEAQALNTAGDP